MLLGLFALWSAIMITPFVCADPLRSFYHIRALTVYSKVNAPGENPTIVKVQEQRLTGLVLSMLVGVTSLAACLLEHIPMVALCAILMYMGLVTLVHLDMVQRLKLIPQMREYHPDTKYIRVVQMRKIHAYTILQVILAGLIFGSKLVPYLQIVFPVLLVLCVPIRMYLLPRCYTECELEALDGESDEEEEEEVVVGHRLSSPRETSHPLPH
ncbi:anion exchange protein 2-like [Convolutriloba macropyga]|uniref:anion exchange protein 2-like n=1 Tax=Convolutriloba macropyga TaxID=536237 RepID=UPI003F51F905